MLNYASFLAYYLLVFACLLLFPNNSYADVFYSNLDQYNQLPVSLAYPASTQIEYSYDFDYSGMTNDPVWLQFVLYSPLYSASGSVSVLCYTDSFGGAWIQQHVYELDTDDKNLLNSGGYHVFSVQTTSALNGMGYCNDAYPLRIGFNSIDYYWDTARIARTLGGSSLPYIVIAQDDEDLPEDELIIEITEDITDYTIWAPPAVYKISGNINVDGGGLTIKPGTIIKFDTSTSSSLILDTTLEVQGEANSGGVLKNVFFTSIKDDLIGGDTNGDGASSTPSAGDWGDIKINSGNSATFNYSTVRYGGGGVSGALLHNEGNILSVSSSTFTKGTDYGIRNSSGVATIITSDISFNDYGLYVDGGSASITASSTIHNNNLYGIYNDTIIGYVNAENNWWGFSSGPYHSTNNSSGDGNVVSGLVDFTPWITDIHFIINEMIDCSSLHGCNSVSNESIFITESTKYSTELSGATSTWNTLGSVDIVMATSTVTLEIEDVDLDDVAWRGRWTPFPLFPDQIKLNEYYLDQNTSAEVQHTITHELGHALGLDHSFTGNIMYSYQTSQTLLGSQDENDYYYLWP